jgi:hypothetical protein
MRNDSQLPLYIVAGVLIIAGIATSRGGGDRIASVAIPAIREAVALRQSGDWRWYRGNMHTHSYWSDGGDFLESIALWYRERGYDFLVFSDHNVLADSERWIDIAATKSGRQSYDKLVANFPDWIDRREVDGELEVRLRTFREVAARFNDPGQYLLIQGEEITDELGALQVHLNASHIAELITPRGGETVLEVMQNNVDAVVAQRERSGLPTLVHLNHPNYTYGVTAEDLMRVVGENFFEVYNGSPSVANHGDHFHASTDRLWDIVLTFRIAELGLPLMYGLACDDSHDYHQIPSRDADPGRGWVQVLATDLTPESLIASLEAGRFYASSGVRLESIASGTEQMTVAVAAEPGVNYMIEFIGTRAGFDATSTEVVDRDGRPIRTTRRYSNEVGAVLQSSRGSTATYRFAGDELYVRARVTSSKLHPDPSAPGEYERAWCRPVCGAGGMQE